MKVREFAEKLQLTCVFEGDIERDIEHGYIGDLLSWVMGRAKPGAAWITIMSNVNVAAVASLTDVACVILAENVQPDEALKAKFSVMGATVFSTPMNAYEIAWKLHEVTGK